jgi:hypothetical protein
MSESESAPTEVQNATASSDTEEITYQAVEKDGVSQRPSGKMKGRKHLRTHIESRGSRQGRENPQPVHH